MYKHENREAIMRRLYYCQKGFTLVEVIVAGIVMVVLCVGLLTVFSYVTNINRGNNIRAQALAALQQEIEFYRTLRFVPGLRTAADLPNHRHANLYDSTGQPSGSWTRPQVTSASGMVFDVTVTVTNLGYAPDQIPSPSEEACTFKEIVIKAVPAVTQEGWLSDDSLKTTITMQRVRTN
jgi:type II secretory pathway pseudopilin PulG